MYSDKPDTCTRNNNSYGARVIGTIHAVEVKVEAEGDRFSFLMGQESFQGWWDFRRAMEEVCDLDGRTER